MSSISAYLMAGLNSLLLILMICELFCATGIVIVDNGCNGVVMIGVIAEISRMLAVFAVKFDEAGI